MIHILMTCILDALDKKYIASSVPWAGQPIPQPLQDASGFWRLGKREEFFAQRAIGTVPFHRQRMDDRADGLLRCHGYDANSLPFIIGVRAEDDADVRFSVEHVIQDTA